MRRLPAVLGLSVLVVLLAAGPAIADPAEPTNYHSRINIIDPAPTGVTIEVVGGDAFLSVAVAEGHSVLIPGYFNEPYLRIDPDGKVFLNENSPARYINEDRWGLTEIPEGVDANSTPEWIQVESDGRFAWHDHRTHWMSPHLPPTIAGDRIEIIFPWTLPLFIDGVETEVRGELLWFPSVNPLGPILTGFLGILPFLAWRPGQRRPLVVAGMVMGALALMVAVTQFAATPGFDRGFPVAAIFPTVAIVTSVAAAWLRPITIRTWALTLTAGLALLWWVFGIADALTAPVLPSSLPAGIERSIVALAGWTGLGILLTSAYEIFRSTRNSTAPIAEGATS